MNFCLQMVGHADVPLTNTYFPDKHLVVHDFMFFFVRFLNFKTITIKTHLNYMHIQLIFVFNNQFNGHHAVVLHYHGPAISKIQQQSIRKTVPTKTFGYAIQNQN